MQGSLQSAVGRLVRGCQWVATAAFIGCAWLVVDHTTFYEPVGRSFFIVVAVIPPALFLVGLYFYEEQQYRLDDTQWIASTIVFLLLALPCLLLNWRFTVPLSDQLGWGFVLAGTILGISSAIPRQPDWAKDNAFLSLVLHYHRVMREAWSHGQKPATDDTPLSPRTLTAIAHERGRFYASAEDLLAFQQTLTCPEQDADRLIAHLGGAFRRKSTLRVVDIGGAEGRFTGQLLAGLERSGVTIGALTNIDPAPLLQDKYLHAIIHRSSLRPQQIAQEGRGIEDTLPPECDLLLASHSLYAALDRAFQQGDAAVEGQIQRLVDRVQPGGAMVVILSSRHSMAIATKRRIYELLYGTHSFDTVAETFDPFLARAARLDKRLQSDTLIDLTQVLRSYEQSGKIGPEFRQWGSYFLRLDLRTLSDRHVRAIADDFLSKSFRLSELPESLQTAGTAVASLGLHGDSRVLPHKSVIYLLRPGGSRPPVTTS